ncbi:hypothetical protein GPALN_005350 [Globodera pallida]|nr:hypothetical protein GPALN_005350 [Globodera pallida]
MNLKKLMRNEVESQQKMKKQYQCGKAKSEKKKQNSNTSSRFANHLLETKPWSLKSQAQSLKIFGQVRKDVNCEVFVETGTDISLRQMLRRFLMLSLSRKDGESMLILYNSRFHDQIEATLCWFSRFTRESSSKFNRAQS